MGVTDGDHQPILGIRELTRIAGGRTLLDGVSFDVEAGRTVAVLGPSGSGKSTLLRLLVRLDEPTRGTVLIEGRNYRSLDPRDLRRRIGFVAQRPALFPGSVGDNLRFGPAQRGVAMASGEVEGLLAEMGLEGYARRTVENLSGGEAQRVGLARTLANDPDVLLLDEPTSALDASARDGVEKLVCRVIADRSLTCLIVTHDEGQARRMASDVVLLEEGRLVRVGPVEEVLGVERGVR